MIDRRGLRDADQIGRNRRADARDRAQRERDGCCEKRKADRRQPLQRCAGAHDSRAREIVERRPRTKRAIESAVAIKSQDVRKICGRVCDPLCVVQVVVGRVRCGRIESQRDRDHKYRDGNPQFSCHLAEFVSQLIQSSKAFQKRIFACEPSSPALLLYPRCFHCERRTPILCLPIVAKLTFRWTPSTHHRVSRAAARTHTSTCCGISTESISSMETWTAATTGATPARGASSTSWIRACWRHMSNLGAASSPVSTPPDR